MNVITTTMPLAVRMQKSPFWGRSHAPGAKGYFVYNNTLIATGFTKAEDQYHHLKSAVQVWDVGCERQIEIVGPDAAKLVQMSTPRDLAWMKDDQCFYIPTVDGEGCMTNDPVLVKVDEDWFWVSISDSDQILLYKGVAAALRLDVVVRDPMMFPLAIRGPRADDLASHLWGDAVRDLKLFCHMRIDVNGQPMLLARLGFSAQGGFELYFDRLTGGDLLWNQLFEAGKSMDLRAGIPSQSGRIEAGMLSFLSDITADMTPFEAGLDKMCEMSRDVGCLGCDALRASQSPTRRLKPVEIEGAPLAPQTEFWAVTNQAGDSAGRVSSSCRAFSYDVNASIASLDESVWNVRTPLIAQTLDGSRDAVVKDKFWGRN